MPSFEQPEGALATEAQAIANFKKLTLMVAGAAAKYEMDGKINLKEQQELVLFIADMLIDLYLAESALLRVQKMLSNKSTEKISYYENMLKLFIHDAQYRMTKNANDALASFARGDEQKVLFMGVKRFAKYPYQPVMQLRKSISDKMIAENQYCF